jgi:hypothetical protein
MMSLKYTTYPVTEMVIDKKIKDALQEYDAPFQPTTIVVGVNPKKQSKNKFIQLILIKLFGYEIEYKTVMARTIVIKAEDCPTSLNGEFTFTIGEEKTND